jgi:hypothetical protein
MPAYSTCVGNRAACDTNAPVALSGNFAVAGGLITAADINTLKNAIRKELENYAKHRSFANAGAMTSAYNSYGSSGADHGAGVTDINDLHINDYETITQQVNNVVEPVGSNYAVLTEQADNTTAPNSYAQGNLVEDTHWSVLLAKYNTMRQDCICNSDCACNLVCSCNGNCGCNYSDERLKENIKYLYTKKGIKLYSFNYIWDKSITKVGVMAQDLLNTVYSNAVLTDKNGYYKVDYNKLPI